MEIPKELNSNSNRDLQCALQGLSSRIESIHRVIYNVAVPYNYPHLLPLVPQVRPAPRAAHQKQYSAAAPYNSAESNRSGHAFAVRMPPLRPPPRSAGSRSRASHFPFLRMLSARRIGLRRELWSARRDFICVCVRG